MISRSTVDAIYEAARVEEVVGDFVVLKKAGSSLKGLSPFVNEKTPSFYVSPSKQIWKDFSSGKGGNAVSFLMEHEHFSYPEALRYLAKKYNIEIQETLQTEKEKAESNERESLYLVSEFAKKFFEECLHNTDEGKSVGLSYFVNRGFSTKTIQKFGLGYSPTQWDSLIKVALEKGYNIDYLIKTGLASVSEKGQTFDKFYSRVIFPIQSMSGRVLGFGARILDSTSRKAKYLNSPESDIYHKSKILYGIYQAKQAISREDSCYLVEGYTDVIQMHQAGVENVVSSSGTALTTEQIRLVQRLTKNIVLLFDGDAAGIKASFRGVNLLLEAGMNVRICPFPEGEDPDSFAKKTSTEELKQYLKENAVDFIRFKTSTLIKEVANDPIKKAGLVKDIVESIAKIPDNIQQEIYIKECAKLMEISEGVLFSALAQILAKELNEEIRQEKKETQLKAITNLEVKKNNSINIVYHLEKKLIEILLLYGNSVEAFKEERYEVVKNQHQKESITITEHKVNRRVFDQVFLSLQDDELIFSTPLFKEIYTDMLSYYQTHHQWHLENYLSKIKNEYSSEISSIIMDDERESLHNWESQNVYVKTKRQSVAQYVDETLFSLRWYYIHSKINEIKEKLLALSSNQEDIKEKNVLLAEIIDYTKLIRLIADRLGRVMEVF